MPDNTPEHVALELMHLIAKAENKEFGQPVLHGKTIADRPWILRTYAECLEAVKDPHFVKGQYPHP